MIRDLLSLMKIRITVAVTLTTATGYFLGPGGGLNAGLGWVVIGTLLLAGGSACLNHVQDARLDATMARTRHRPIPSGRVRPMTALFVAGLLILLGLSLLASVEGHVATVLALGALAVLWYNGVYTPLKRATAFAVIPGALIGAIPPVIGFAAAGGHWLDTRILLVAGFFYMWQIPHFWILSMMYDDQYREAGLPTLMDVFDHRQRLRLTFTWVLAAAGAGMALSVARIHPMGLGAKITLILASLWLASRAVDLVLTRSASVTPFRRAFRRINAYALVVIVSLSLNALLGPAPTAVSPATEAIRPAIETPDRS